MNDKTQKYIVTQKHTLNHAINDVIELTDKKAFALSGKIELYIEPVAASKTEKKSKKAGK
jgi:hypothetical protein